MGMTALATKTATCPRCGKPFELQYVPDVSQRFIDCVVCDDCTAELERQRQRERTDQQIAMLIDDAIGLQDLPPDFRKYELRAAIAHDIAEQVSALTLLRETQQHTGVIWLCGPRGTGKTHLGMCFLHRAAKSLKTIAKRSVRQVIEEARFSDSSGLRRWQAVDVLLLDDIDKFPISEHSVSILWELFDARQDKLTLVTANARPDVLRDDWRGALPNGRTVTATLDRFEPLTVVEVLGESLRGKGAA